MRRFILTLAALGALLLAGTAVAGDGDRNDDRIPDRWEKRHGLSLKVKQTHRDQDRDGLRNLAEYRAGTDPRDRDSDDDGTRDRDEHAGRVTAYADGVLTIGLFGGGELTGRVTDRTELKCENEHASSSARRDGGSSGSDGDDDRSGHGSGDDGSSGRGSDGDDDDRGDDDRDRDDRNHSDDDDNDRDDNDRDDNDRDRDDDRGGDRDRTCAAGALAVGAVVEEAELKITSAGRVWDEVELR